MTKTERGTCSGRCGLLCETLHPYGVCERVVDRLQRLEQIVDALPYIDMAMRRHNGDKAFCEACRRRFDALAAKVHDPKGIYASIVHKRSFAEVFA